MSTISSTSPNIQAPYATSRFSGNKTETVDRQVYQDLYKDVYESSNGSLSEVFQQYYAAGKISRPPENVTPTLGHAGNPNPTAENLEDRAKAQEAFDKIDWDEWARQIDSMDRFAAMNKAMDLWDSDPSSRWDYRDETAHFADNDIMKWMTEITPWGSDEMFPVDEYGYSTMPPACPMPRPEYGMYRKTWEEIRAAQDDSMFVIHDEHPETAPPQEVYKEPDTITSKDRVGLTGLTLDERKTFLDGVQQLLDENNIRLNSRELIYGGGITGPFHINDRNGTMDLKSQIKMIDLISQDETLHGLVMKSGRVQVGQTVDTATAQAYNIKVTDAAGNALPKDQIIIEAGDKSGKQVQMSVEEFLQLDRREILQRLG